MAGKSFGFNLYGDELTGKTEMTQKGSKIEKVFKIPQLTMREFYVLLVLSRDTNYIYSTWKELGKAFPRLDICLSGIRAIFLKFQRQNILRQMFTKPYTPRRGPKRNLFTITVKGKYILRFYQKSMERITNKPTGRNKDGIL